MNCWLKHFPKDEHKDIIALVFALGLEPRYLNETCSIPEHRKDVEEFNKARDKGLVEGSSFDHTVELAQPYKDEWNRQQLYKIESGLVPGSLF